MFPSQSNLFGYGIHEVMIDNMDQLDWAISYIIPDISIIVFWVDISI